MTRIVFFAFFLLIITSCTQEKPHAEKSPSLAERYQPIRERIKTEAPISVADLKHMEFIEVSSGKATIEWIYNKKYCVPEEKGFFGYYYLINKAKPLKGSFGLLIVYASSKHLDWSNDNADERFVEIRLETPDVALWDSLKVGMSYEKLTAMIGDDGWSAKGTSHFKTLGPYKAEFIVIDGLVDQMWIGKYCEE